MKAVFIMNNEYDCGKYDVVERSDGRKSVIAKGSFLAGELVFREHHILHSKFSDMESIKNKSLESKYGIERHYWAIFDSFLKLNAAAQKELLKLYAPVNSKFANAIRSSVQRCGKENHWKSDKIEEFIKIYNIFNFHGFHTPGGDASIALKSSMLWHSCAPNCKVVSNDLDTAMCRVLSPIKAGEEMCICFEETNMDKPTYIRRKWMTDSKDLFCTCSRCNALSDDTRQFPCEHDWCSGRVAVCQPTIDDIPYMLLCTECGRQASPEYERKMMQIETQLFDVENEIYGEQKNMDQKHMDFTRNYLKMEQLRRLYAVAPKCHAGLWIVSTLLFTQKDSMTSDEKLQLAQNTVAPLQFMTIYPNENICLLYAMAVHLFEEVDTPESLQLAKAYLQVQLQMELVMMGRDSLRSIVPRTAQLDKQMMSVLVKLAVLNRANPSLCTAASVSTIEECMWCGAEPQCTSITLSLCGQCHKVAYCTKDCQKLHWKLHKTLCVAAPSSCVES